MTARARQSEQERLLRDLARELRGLRAEGGAERLVERQLAALESRMESVLEEMLKRTLGQLLGGTGGTGGIGGLLSGLFDLPRLADGGVIDGAQLLALGGEAGPEAVLPLTRLADGRLGVRAEAGQAPVIVNITLGEGASMDDLPDGLGEGLSPERQASLAVALGESLEQVLDQAVAERIRIQLRDGGVLSGGDWVAD